ncbi:hypothetical protein [Streptococcus hyointestinalis]|nr:hypothetical protein [Streptococcus hyointestinalis]
MENDNITLLKEKLRLAELNSDMALEELIVILESVQGTFDKKAFNQYFAPALSSCKEALRDTLNLQGDTEAIGRNYVATVQAPNMLRYLNENQKEFY